MINNNTYIHDKGDHIPHEEPLSRKLLDMIPYGEENARHMSDLANYFGVEERDIRREILHLRIRGTIIASSQNGYFIPETRQELYTYYRKAKGRALTTLRSLKRTRRILCGMGLKPDANGEEVFEDEDIRL